MATCKDCVHYAPCFSGGVSVWNNIEQTEDKHCPYFKNKANVVEVVRCKDCKRYIKGHAGEQSNYCDCHTTTFEKFFCMPNDYCSCGERKCDNE